MGSFLWFESRDDLLSFVGRSLTFFSPGPSAADHGAVAGEVEAIVRQITEGERIMEDAIPALNKVLRNFSQIRWWGTLEELLSGDAPFVCEVRTWFREAETEEGSDLAPERPIAADEVNDFLGSLVDWGL